MFSDRAQPYILPTLEYLLSQVETLRDEYLNEGGTDQKRLDQIKALETSINQIKWLTQHSILPKETLRQLAFAEWFKCFEVIERSYDYTGLNPERSTLYRIIKRKLQITSQNKSHFTAVNKMNFFNPLFNFKFEDESTANTFAQAFTDAGLDIKQERLNLLTMLRTAAAPLANDVKKAITVLPSEAALDAYLEKFYEFYMNESSSDNSERRFLARLIKSVRDLLPRDEKEQINFLSHNYRVKLGIIATFGIEQIANEWKYSVPLFWGPQHSAAHRLSNEALQGNYPHVPDYIKHECRCAAESFLKDFSAKKNLEKILNDRTKFPKEAPVYIHTVLRPMQESLAKQIEKYSPLHPQTSNLVIAAEIVGAIAGLVPGAAAGIAMGFGASLTNPSKKAQATITPFTGYVMEYLLGDGGKLLASYSAEVYFDAGLKFTAGATVGAICAALGALGFGSIAIALTQLTPTVVKELVNFYSRVINDPKVAIALKAVSFNAIKPEILTCLLDSPKEVFSDEIKEKALQLGGDAKAMQRLFAHHETLKVMTPKAAHPNLVLGA